MHMAEGLAALMFYDPSNANKIISCSGNPAAAGDCPEWHYCCSDVEYCGDRPDNRCWTATEGDTATGYNNGYKYRAFRSPEGT